MKQSVDKMVTDGRTSWLNDAAPRNDWKAFMAFLIQSINQVIIKDCCFGAETFYKLSFSPTIEWRYPSLDITLRVTIYI